MRVMHHHQIVLLLLLLAAILLLLFPQHSYGAFKCMVDGQVTYSDQPCGPSYTPSGAASNSYSGSLRPGEARLLEKIDRLPAPAAGPSGNSESGYAKELKQRNDRVKQSADTPKRHSTDYQPRARSPWR